MRKKVWAIKNRRHPSIHPSSPSIGSVQFSFFHPSQTQTQTHKIGGRGCENSVPSPKEKWDEVNEILSLSLSLCLYKSGASLVHSPLPPYSFLAKKNPHDDFRLSLWVARIPQGPLYSINTAIFASCFFSLHILGFRLLLIISASPRSFARLLRYIKSHTSPVTCIHIHNTTNPKISCFKKCCCRRQCPSPA